MTSSAFVVNRVLGASVREVFIKLRSCTSKLKHADHEFVRWTTTFPATVADSTLKRLTASADHSKLWFTVAAVCAANKGPTRRAALRGIAAIAASSAVTGLAAKPLLPRRRPATDLLPAHRRLAEQPSSSSFPSGHAASAAAFTTAVFLEAPALGWALAPVAAAVAYSRVHTGVHWPTDIAVGSGIGIAVGLATRRWWPVRPSAPGIARPSQHAPALADGDGLVLLVNPSSGDPAQDPSAELADLWPTAKVVHPDLERDLVEQLHAELDVAGEQVQALGVAGGDGTVAAAAAVAAARGLPLVVAPVGTLNHFARDLGVPGLRDSARALAAGSAVQVGLGAVRVDERPARWFVNTASLGGYPDMVRLREKWEPSWDKWPAAAAALIRVLAEAQPIAVRMDGATRHVWLLFIGNNSYQPKGFVPSWRPRLDGGVLDVRYVRADLPLSRVRFTVAALAGALARSRTYVQEERTSLRVEVLGQPVALACDGEVHTTGKTFAFSTRDEVLRAYRPDDAP